MAWSLIVVALIAAGAYTDNVAFYWVSGVAGVVFFITWLVAITIISAAKSQIKDFSSDFKNFPRR
jgi:hypothetical protein